MYMTTMTMADVRARFREVLDDVERTHQRVVVTRRGAPAAVIMAIDDYEAIQETMEILSDPEEVAAIREGLEAADRGELFTLEEVRRELGL